VRAQLAVDRRLADEKRMFRAPTVVDYRTQGETRLRQRVPRTSASFASSLCLSALTPLEQCERDGPRLEVTTEERQLAGGQR
jgi:hypothetical protein